VEFFLDLGEHFGCRFLEDGGHARKIPPEPDFVPGVR
jgi:hypothetical protein